MMRKTLAFARPGVARVWLCAVFLLLSNVPAIAQFGGDAFSAGDSFTGKGVTGTQTVTVPRDYVFRYFMSGWSRRKDLFANCNTSGATDPFEQGVDNYKPYMRTSLEEVVETVVHLEIEPDRFDIVFFKEPTPNAVLRALKCEHKTAGVIGIKKMTRPYFEKNWNLQRVEQEITKVRTAFDGGKEERFMVVRKGRPNIKVFYESASHARLIALELRAVELEHGLVQKWVREGTIACYRKNWNLAWNTFQKIIKVCDDDADVFETIGDIYHRFSRDSEACVWYSRSLACSKHWVDFNSVWNKRDAIEYSFAEAALKEEGPNVPWVRSGERLKVCFPGADKPHYDSRLKEVATECLFDWFQAAGARLDYEETKNAREADIVFEWTEPEDRYAGMIDAKLPPKVSPHGETLGESIPTLVRNRVGFLRLTKATIKVYARDGGESRVVSDDLLRAICLHEIGHALGINKHNRAEPTAVMYPYCNIEAPKLDLHQEDKELVLKLYRFSVATQAASDRFLGMRAQQESLVLTDIATNNLKQNQIQQNNSH